MYRNKDHGLGGRTREHKMHKLGAGTRAHKVNEGCWQVCGTTGTGIFPVTNLGTGGALIVLVFMWVGFVVLVVFGVHGSVHPGEVVCF